MWHQFLFFSHSTRLLAATTLRNVLGTKNLSEILSERDTISNVMKTLLDEATDPWGVRVERVEVKDVRLPVQLQRAMAAEAEAAREARAKVMGKPQRGLKYILLLRLLRPRGSRRRAMLSRRPARSCPRTPPPCSSDTSRSGNLQLVIMKVKE